MPELPEVETIIRQLKKEIRGKRILDFNSLGDEKKNRFFRYQKSQDLKRAMIGKKIVDISRLGKNIIFKISGGRFFIVHLMMTGKFYLNPGVSRSHDRFCLKLSGSKALVYNDARKFGWGRIVGNVETLAGTDALDASLAGFEKIISPRKGAIKTLLLNQKLIAGIGNIYADEILWYAGINPLRSAVSLRQLEIKKLYKSLRKVLLLAIKTGGTTSRDYIKPDGSKGKYYAIRKAYQRQNLACAKDRGIIKRVIIGQRSTHFCPVHQI